MKKIGLKIVFSLLLLCLLALPGSAEEWKLGFENHPNDLWTIENPIIEGDKPFSLEVSGSNQYLSRAIVASSTPSSNYGIITLNKNFEDYFAFTVKTGAFNSIYLQNFEVFLSCYNSEGTPILNSQRLITNNSLNSQNFRVEILKDSNNQYSYYVNGEPSGTFSLNITDMTQIQIKTVCHSAEYPNKQVNVYCDDFLADPDNFQIMISTDETHQLFTSPSVSVGFYYLPYMVQFYRVYDPSGSICQNGLLTSCSQVITVNASNATDLGRYTFRIYQVNNDTTYFLDSEYFIIGSDDESSGSGLVEFDRDMYNIGDSARVYSHISPYEAGSSIKFVYGSSSQYLSRALTSEDQTIVFTIPADSSNYIFVYLLDAAGDIIGFDQAEIAGKSSKPVLSLDKESYSPSDSIQVQYWYMPIGTKLTATYYLNGVKKSSSTITINDVIGTEYFTIGGREADSVTVSASSDRELYATASASIKYGKYSISGKVYDAVTGSTIPGAIVFTPGFTVETDQLGYYNHSTEPGILNVTVSASGYEDHHTSMYINSLVTTKNFYLTPVLTSETGSSVYGIVSDWYNGSSIGGCYITLKNGSVSYSALTTSKGYYSIEKPDMVGSWTITASKNGYDTYTSTVSISGDTYKGIRLVPSGGAVPDDSDGSDGSDDSDDSDGSDDSGSSTDRPSRAAARDSLDWLESTMPNLIKLVVVIFVLALIGVKL